MLLHPIGMIHSSYKEKKDAPRQGRLSSEIQEIEVYPEYIEGLRGIEKVTHIIVLYWLHESNRETLQSRSPIDSNIKGVFSSRSPNRPNPIAFTVAELLSITENRIKVKGIDAIDGTPLLDIKVYAPTIDCVEQAKVE